MSKQEWTHILHPRTSWFDINISQIWAYRDLILLFVKRDFVSVYKQTILGPVWYFIQPLFSTLVFTLIFSRVARIPTDDVPPSLFYMTGITAWNYFSDCLNKTSSTFTANAGIFGKVYFPRMVIPLSVIISNLIKFFIQFSLLLLLAAYYYSKGANVHPNIAVMLTPVLILMMAGIGLGAGIIISSLTTKYRDLQYFLAFGIQLLMYASPIVYPLSMLHGKLRTASMLNPLTSVIEAFKYAYLGSGALDVSSLLYSFCFMLLLLFAGLALFNRVEKSFMDTV